MNLKPLLVVLALGAIAGAVRAERIPLCEGLTVVAAVSDEHGDYQTISVVEKVGGTLRTRVSAELPIAGACDGCPRSRRVTAYHNTLRSDWESSHLELVQLADGEDTLYPGYGAPSRAMLAELAGRGDTSFYWSRRVAGGNLGRFTSAVRRANAIGRRSPDEGKLAKVEAVSFPVLVNDRRVALPAILARGHQQGRAMELLILDDPENPMPLRHHLDVGAAPDPLGLAGEIRSEVIQIRFPDPGAPAPIAAALAGQGRVEVEGIFFDFGSDVLRPESEPVLAQIAAALSRNPSWKLVVEGHTDSVGGDSYNLDLSRRRAAAVKAALVDRWHIAPARLDTAGYGATRPKEPNDTLAGRARNRRVELARI